MNIESVYKRIALRKGYSYTKVRDICQAFIKDIKETLRIGHSYDIPGLCKFEVKKVYYKNVKNPKTGEWIGQKEFYTIKIKKSRALQEIGKELTRQKT